VNPVRRQLALMMRRCAWHLEGRPDRRGPMERAQDAAQDPRIRRRVVFVAWVSGVIVGEFLLPATSPLGQVIEGFMRGAGYEQNAPGSLGPYPSAPGRGGVPVMPDRRETEPAALPPGPLPSN
jgi:hypothetical protein